MNILVLHDGIEIKAWLVNEPLDLAPQHIANGYPELMDAWEAETLQAVILDVPEPEAFSSHLYEVADGAVVRKQI